jgi:hypothetical protein
VTFVNPLLVSCLASLSYDAVILSVPALVALYVIEHLAVSSSVQLLLGEPSLEKLPVPSLDQLTVPVGVLGVPPEVSVTVAVQVVFPPARKELGVQLTPVCVERFVTVTVSPPELSRCVSSPP